MIIFFRSLSPYRMRGVRMVGLLALTIPLINLANGRADSTNAAKTIPARASLQEVMDAIVDPSADGLWDSVDTTVTAEGEHTRTPQTEEDWADVRRKMIVLRESASLLRVRDRPVAHRAFAAEAAGALDSKQIADRILRDRAVFDAFAAELGVTAQHALQAVAAHDTNAMVRIGGDLDAICESCHMHFWYPNQVIPWVH